MNTKKEIIEEIEELLDKNNYEGLIRAIEKIEALDEGKGMKFDKLGKPYTQVRECLEKLKNEI